MSSILDLLPSSYGYVILAAAGGTLVNFYLSASVMKARKIHKVKVSE